MIKEFDLYDYLMEKLLFLRADKRLDLRIMIALLLKAAFLIIWYLVVKDASKFTWVAIGMNLATWPIYHLFFFLAEFRYLTDGQIDHQIRKVAFRITDQFQNFILLIEFCILILYYDYNSQFHKIVVALLAVDNIVFVIQNIVTCCINRKNNYKTSDAQVSKLAKKTALQIIEKLKEYKQVLQLEYYTNTEQNISNIDEETLSQKIQVQVINKAENPKQKVKQDQVFKLCYDYNAQIYFDTSLQVESKSTVQIFGKGDKKGLSAFYLMFFIGSVTSMIILMILLLPIKGGQVLTIFIILEVIGNFVIVCFGCLNCCDCGCCSEICQKSFKGLIFGITSVYYGIIFGAIVIIACAVFMIIFGIMMQLGMVVTLAGECSKAFKKCTFCYDKSCQQFAFVICMCYCCGL